jgi:hypothetical protein
LQAHTVSYGYDENGNRTSQHHATAAGLDTPHKLAYN